VGEFLLSENFADLTRNIIWNDLRSNYGKVRQFIVLTRRATATKQFRGSKILQFGRSKKSNECDLIVNEVSTFLYFNLPP
jgi:hypothetical protein